MKSNFKLIWWFWIAEKEIKKRNILIEEIINKYYDVWIREFFIWYNPPYWHENFWFEFSPNMRFWENEQITSYETFKKAIDFVHTLKTNDWQNCEIFLAMNFRYYTDITMPIIEKIILEWINAWVDWIIVWNIETLEFLSKINYKWKVNISTILSIYNEDAIEFFIEYFSSIWLNLNRVILPREMTLNEIKYLCETFPKINFEVFWHWDYCRYSNWLCLAEHKYFSRDLCWFVLKHWLKITKILKYNFKQIILDTSTDNLEKQKLLDNELDEIENIFTTQYVVWTNSENNLIDKYIQYFQFINENNYDQNEITDICLKIYKQIKIQFSLNFYRFFYDWIRPENDLHNNFITKFLILFNFLSKYINIDEKIISKIEQIKKIYENWRNNFKNQLSKKWKFWIESLYKFMLYNRTSVPFYKFFNEIKNIEIVKIPLRWRDLSVFKLWIDMIDQAISQPEKFLDISNISWKYFHYDPTSYDIYKNQLKKITQ